LNPIKDATWKLRHRQRGQQAQHDGRARPADRGLRELAPVLSRASLASPLSPKGEVTQPNDYNVTFTRITALPIANPGDWKSL